MARPAVHKKPKWSQVIAKRRVCLGKTQADIAADSEDVLSQGNITDIESGKVHLENVGVRKAVVLARALDWTLKDMQAATGVNLGF
jgi:predicted transcriptional regulator